MKKHLVFTLLFSLLLATGWSQTATSKATSTVTTTLIKDTTIVIAPKAPDKATKFFSKGDSLMVVLANKQHIDTNASAEQIGAILDNLDTLIPPGSPRKYPLKWLTFLGAIVFAFGTVYFFVKHKILKAKAVAQGLKLSILIGGLMFLSGCTGFTKLFTANSAAIKESIGKKGIYLEEYAVVHTAPGQNDTAAFLAVGPDSITDNLVSQLNSFISKSLGLNINVATSIKPFTSTGYSQKQMIGKQGYYLEEFEAVHQGGGQYDTLAVYLVGPDSVVNNYVTKIKSFIVNKAGLTLGYNYSPRFIEYGYIPKDDLYFRE